MTGYLNWERSKGCATALCLCTLIATADIAVAESGGDNRRCVDTAEWGKEALEFVAVATGKPVPEPCVRRVDTTTLEELTAGARRTSHEAVSRATYIPASGDILLARDLDMSDPLERSYLVHEFVHAQQFASGSAQRAPCVGVLEGEAYAAQAAYLRARGRQRDAFLFELLGMLHSACAHEYR